MAKFVLEDAQEFLGEIQKFRPISFELQECDIFDYETDKRFDISFHVGVVEHFLKREQRDRFWTKLCKFTKPNGWVVSVVPCGRHIMRKRIRAENLAGYDVPEIDYGTSLHTAEFESAGLQSIRAFPVIYFRFLSVHPSWAISRVVYPILYLVGNATLPLLPLPLGIKERFAHTLIVVGQKPSD